MVSSEDKALENQLIEAGKRLLTPPSSVEELLPLLDQVENCLAKVEQSPSGSMLDALGDSMKALVANELLRHSDMDVKVALASCISEITRITAPEAPYNDDQMKEIFQLIVGAFENFDKSSRSYDKRVSILETVAKVRSCVVMLDLECDALILEMFQHFLKAIREDHPDNVFTSMETIMTLVLEESEEISSELLHPLLNTVKKENQDALPTAKKLAEKVLESCDAKLKPYLMQAVRSMGSSMRDYSKVVASICQETVDKVEINDGSAPEEHLEDEKKNPEGIGSDEAPQADQEKMQEMIGSDETPQVTEELKPGVASPGAVDSIVEKSQKSVMSNGTAQTGNSESLIGSVSLDKKELSHSSNPPEDEPNVNSSNIVNSENPDHIVEETRDQKSNSSTHSAEASNNSRMDSDREAGGHADGRKSCNEEAISSPSKGISTDEAILPSENEKKTSSNDNAKKTSSKDTEKKTSSKDNEKKTQSQCTSPTLSLNEMLNAASPTPSQSLLDGTNPKKGQRSKKKKSSNQDSDPDSSTVPKGSFSNEHIEDEAPPAADVISKKESKANKDSDTKKHLKSGKKVKANEGKILHMVDEASMKESGLASDSEAKPVRRPSEKVDERTSKEDEPSPDKLRTKKGREKTNSKKDVTGEPSNKEKVSSVKHTKSSKKDGSHLEETRNTQSKRKRTQGKEVASETPNSVKDYGKDVVGSKIKVWWPIDKTFYKGTITNFDSAKKKHTVEYDDDEVEVLNLKKQRFKFVGEDSDSEMEEATEHPSSDSSEMPQKKKAKADLDSSTSQPKTSSAKRGGGSSVSKSKGAVTKSGGGKSKENTSKPAGKYKDENSSRSKNGTPKSSTKLKKEEAQNPGSKSKDDKTKDDEDGTRKTSNKVKEAPQKRSGKGKVKDDEDAAPKSSSKPKDETANTSSKSSANGTSAKKGKSRSLTKVQESSSKGKSVKAEESESKSGKKAQESGTKRGKKRPRRASS